MQEFSALATVLRCRWRLLLDPGMWFRSLLLTAVFVVFLSALACVVGLARDTTGHDWHASGKLFWAETLLALHFDPRTQVKYRTREGKEVTIARGDLTFSGDALLARDSLLHTAKRSAELGAWWGFGGALLCLVLVWCHEAKRGERCTSREASRMRPGSGSPTPVATAHVRAPADRPKGPDAPRPRKPRPAGTDRRTAAPGSPDGGASHLRYLPAPRDAASIIALYASLIRWLARLDGESRLPPEPPTEIIAENRWLAQRYGVLAFLGGMDLGGRVDIEDYATELIEKLTPDARALACEDQMRHALTIIREGSSADRQVDHFRLCRLNGESREEAMRSVVDMVLAETRGRVSSERPDGSR